MFDNTHNHTLIIKLKGAANSWSVETNWRGHFNILLIDNFDKEGGESFQYFRIRWWKEYLEGSVNLILSEESDILRLLLDKANVTKILLKINI